MDGSALTSPFECLEWEGLGRCTACAVALNEAPPILLGSHLRISVKLGWTSDSWGWLKDCLEAWHKKSQIRAGIAATCCNYSWTYPPVWLPSLSSLRSHSTRSLLYALQNDKYSQQPVQTVEKSRDTKALCAKCHLCPSMSWLWHLYSKGRVSGHNRFWGFWAFRKPRYIIVGQTTFQFRRIQFVFFDCMAKGCSGTSQRRALLKALRCTRKQYTWMINDRVSAWSACKCNVMDDL